MENSNFSTLHFEKSILGSSDTSVKNVYNISYIRADDNVIINEKCIKWVKKIDECLSVCTKSIGCSMYDDRDVHKICKTNNLTSYNKLNIHFQS